MELHLSSEAAPQGWWLCWDAAALEASPKKKIRKSSENEGRVLGTTHSLS